jgi:SEC-C motif-containing protein
MTLIVAVGNPDQFVQVSDRRLTGLADGRVVTDEANKSIILKADDALLIGGYSGIARTNSFNARDWILDTLYDCAEQDCIAENILLRFRDRASEKFKNSPSLKGKSLSILFSGWHDHYISPLAFQVIVSNNKDPNHIYRSAGVKPEFEYMSRSHENLGAGIDLVNSWIGMPFEMYQEDKEELAWLISSRKPVFAIRGKLISVVRKFSKMPSAGGTVGGQLTSIVLPRSPEDSVVFDYHSHIVKPEIYVPDVLYLTSNGRQTRKDVELAPVDMSSTPPLSVPKVKPNQPCPCNSGLAYKDCHGEKGASRPPFEIVIGKKK